MGVGASAERAGLGPAARAGLVHRCSRTSAESARFSLFVCESSAGSISMRTSWLNLSVGVELIC
eukprot:512362-Pleurochrysis_carterae.AAC.1